MLVKKSLTQLAEMIATRRVSSVEVVEAHLEQISKRNPSLNAIVTIASDALAKASAADAVVKSGDRLGSLHGVPVTIKDTIETAGIRTTSGSKIRASFVPERDAPCVVRLKAAGAIVIGKTNVAEMAMDYNADNPVFSRGNHPLNSSFTPGGSSGGEAAAISTFMSPGGIGSDLAGSIRIPAHFCGVAGLKPTTGRVPGEGQFPPNSGPYSLGAVVGPLARTVADLKAMFAALSTGSEEPPPSLKNLRVAWYTNDGIAPVTTETANAVETVAEILSDAGFDVEQERPPHVDQANALWLRVFSQASVVQLRNVYAGRESEGGSFVSWRLKTAGDATPPTLDDYIEGWMLRDRMREELVDWMATTQILVCPVGATPAFKHDTLKVNVGDVSMGTFRAFSYCQAFNVFDLPVVTIPVGKSGDGLPIGVQIVGRPNAEGLILRVAEIVERAIGDR